MALTLWCERRGIAAVEFALVLPILLVMILGCVELGRYIVLNQKLQHAAISVADLTAREESLSTIQLNNIFAAVQHIIAPFEVGDDAVVVLTGIGAGDEDDKPLVLWQTTGGGNLVATSEIGAPGEWAVLPGNFIVRQDETAIAAEVFYVYRSWLGAIVPSNTLRKAAVFRPRFRSLGNLEN